MKYIKTFESFLNEKAPETGLMFIPRTQGGANKMNTALQGSGLSAEWNTREGYFLFPEDEENYDALEVEIQKLADENGIDGRIEGIFENQSTSKDDIKSIEYVETTPGNRLYKLIVKLANGEEKKLSSIGNLNKEFGLDIDEYLNRDSAGFEKEVKNKYPDIEVLTSEFDVS
jgi:hypothetical protein